MTVIASLFSGISGINSNGAALSVSGDNIANMNTTAFKSGNALFESNLTQQVGSVEVGLGSRLAATNVSFSQGALGSSSRATDLAIQGNGFFAVQNTSGERFYTRAGSFSKNSNGDLVTNVGGNQLLGFQTQNGVVGNNPQAINLDSIDSNPRPSTQISISANLDSSDEALGGNFDGSSFENAQNSSNFSVAGSMFDSLGNSREVTTYFRKTDPLNGGAPNQWEVYTLTSMSNLEGLPGTYDLSHGGGAPEDDTVILKAGTMTFTTDGTLPEGGITFDGASASAWNVTTGGLSATTLIEPGELLNDASDIRWAGATSLDFDEFNIDFGQDPGSSSVVTQFSTGSGSVANSVDSDGQGTGSLQTIDITEEGTIRGIFSNGDARDLFQIPIAQFTNTEGLSRAGSNLFEATAESGEALLGQAGQSGRGQVRSFSLEQSNVDIASEFVKIIQFQRAFQASSRTVSAASDLLQDLVNLGR